MKSEVENPQKIKRRWKFNEIQFSQSEQSQKEKKSYIYFLILAVQLGRNCCKQQQEKLNSTSMTLILFHLIFSIFSYFISLCLPFATSSLPFEFGVELNYQKNCARSFSCYTLLSFHETFYTLTRRYVVIPTPLFLSSFGGLWGCANGKKY